jgi:hypothetical protein
VVKSVTEPDTFPIQNPFNTTIMPESFRYEMLGIMLGNFAAIIIYEYLVVNGTRRWLAAAKRKNAKTAVPTVEYDLAISNGESSLE